MRETHNSAKKLLLLIQNHFNKKYIYSWRDGNSEICVMNQNRLTIRNSEKYGMFWEAHSVDCINFPQITALTQV
jgi:hypothetical protein